MNLKLVTLAGTKIDEDVYEVIIPTVEGDIAVFPDHERLVTLAKDGVITVRKKKTDIEDQLEYFAISGGVVEIDGKHVRILVDEADHGADILEAETKKALDRALQLRDEAQSQIELEKASALIDRHATRLKVADLHRRRRKL